MTSKVNPHLSHYLFFLAIMLATLLLWPISGHAASLATTQNFPDYQRILFAGNAPQELRVESRGSSVILTLSEATGDISSIAARLKPAVIGIQRSADGKQIILNLDKNYRVRQFSSGNTVGVDIIKSAVLPEPAPVTEALTTKNNEVPDVAITSTRPPSAAPKPAAAPVVKEKQISPPPVSATKATIPPTSIVKIEAKITPKTDAKSETEAKPPVSTSVAPTAPAATTTTANAAPVTAPPGASIPAIMTTKKPEEKPAQVQPIAEKSTKIATESVITTKPEITPSPAPVKPMPIVSTSATPTVTETKPTVAAAPATTVSSTIAVASGPTEELFVGVEAKKFSSLIHFPWTTRTAGAVFRNGNDIWIIFNQPALIDTVRLRTILPTTVLAIRRYQLPGHTVLRLETNGSLWPTVEKVKDSYGWKVGLIQDQVTAAKKDTSIQPNAKVPDPYILFDALDVSAPITFIDPVIGDRWLVVPYYEIGTGSINSRDFPEFKIIPSIQGLAIQTLRQDIAISQTRVGLKMTAPGGLTISEYLPYLTGRSAPIKGLSATANVALPYDRWFVETKDYRDTIHRLEGFLITAPKAERPDVLYDLAGVNLAQGLNIEGVAYLNLIEEIAPDYFKSKKLALTRAAANFMAGRLEAAAIDVKSPDIAAMKETQLWKEVIGLFVPLEPRVQGLFTGQGVILPEGADGNGQAKKVKPPPVETQLEQIASNAAIAFKPFDYLAYDEQFIRFYPPDVRQRLGMIAAENYIRIGKYEKAVTIFRILSRDGIFDSVKTQIELLLGIIARDKGKLKEARKILERISKEATEPLFINRAKFALIKLNYGDNTISIAEAIQQLEAMRMGWRGDAHERELLEYLGQLYRDNQQYDMALRTWKEMMNAFPNDPEAIKFQTRTTQLFSTLFLEGKADELSPIKALALFYEFRELTPVGDRGNAMIQKLADRLAAIDLLDSAAQLLEFQVQSRIAGEERARVGAHLALIYLMNQKPDKALSTLEITHYGEMDDALRHLRLRLSAKAFFDMNRNEEALAVMAADNSSEGEKLRLDILWKMKDWSNIIQQAERMLTKRKDLTAQLTDEETQTLLKLTLAYSFEKDNQQLKYLRDYYSGLMKDSRYKDIFNYLTNYTAPMDAKDFALVAKQITGMEVFMQTFRDKIAKGKLSETTQMPPETPPSSTPAPASAPTPTAP
jgi:hypothetical protein